MKQDIETIWVFRKDEKKHQLIKADRFNKEFHKKLFWKNLLIKIKAIFSQKKINWNNPWIVSIGVGIILLIVSLYIN